MSCAVHRHYMAGVPTSEELDTIAFTFNDGTRLAVSGTAHGEGLRAVDWPRPEVDMEEYGVVHADPDHLLVAATSGRTIVAVCDLVDTAFGGVVGARLDLGGRHIFIWNAGDELRVSESAQSMGQLGFEPRSEGL